MKVTLRVEDHANTDYPDVRSRPARIATARCDSLQDAVERARRIQSQWQRGHHKLCIIRVYPDAFARSTPCETLHVSQNGRVWHGDPRDWNEKTVEVKL